MVIIFVPWQAVYSIYILFVKEPLVRNETPNYSIFSMENMIYFMEWFLKIYCG